MDLFYELYKNAGFISIEIVLNGVISSLCFIGICFNLCLVYVTINNKSLHSPCNILIALYAFFISFLLGGYTIKFFVFLFGINFISLRTCFCLQFIPLIGSSVGLSLQLAIGIERLIGVLCPIWYKMHGKFTLSRIILIFICITTPITSYFCYYGASLHWEKIYDYFLRDHIFRQVMCNYGEPFKQPENVKYSLIKTQITYCIEFGCYMLIWLIIFCKKSSEVSSTNKRIMISLSIIMAMGLVCYVLNTCLFNYLLPKLNLDIFTIEYVVYPISTSLYMIANGSTTPILLLCSTEYSKAFRKCLGCDPKVNVVVSMANNQMNH